MVHNNTISPTMILTCKVLNFYKGIHKLYYWGLVNYDKSHSLKINHRSQIGAGVAYNIIDSPHLELISAMASFMSRAIL